MTLEAISGTESIQDHCNETHKVTVWNGRELSLLNEKCKVSFELFDEVNGSFVLCKNEKSENSSSSNKQTESKESKSSSTAKESKDKDSKSSETKQSVYVTGRGDKDNHGNSSTRVGTGYKLSRENENGTRFDIDVNVSHEQRGRDGREDIDNRTSGEITASYVF